MIFCCCANGPVSASGGMFLRISCSWVMNSVTVIAMIRTTVTTCTLLMPSVNGTFRKVSEIRAPKMVAWFSDSTRSGFCFSQ